MSFKSDDYAIYCPNCNCASEFTSITLEEDVVKAVNEFKLENEYVEISSCKSCHRVCSFCELCNHCDRYLCAECVNSHNAMVCA